MMVVGTDSVVVVVRDVVLVIIDVVVMDVVAMYEMVLEAVVVLFVTDCGE